jgi:hypothetical protein
MLSCEKWTSVSLCLVGGERLGLLRGDHSVARDELRHDAADSLNALRERSHVEEEDILGLIATLTGEDATFM